MTHSEATIQEKAYRHGKQAWEIGVSREISGNGSIIAHADRVEVRPDGALVLWSDSYFDNGLPLGKPVARIARDQALPVLILHGVTWTHCIPIHACGGGLAIEHWPPPQVSNTSESPVHFCPHHK